MSKSHALRLRNLRVVLSSNIQESGAIGRLDVESEQVTTPVALDESNVSLVAKL